MNIEPLIPIPEPVVEQTLATYRDGDQKASS